MINILKEKWEEIINTIKISYDMGDLPFKTWILPLQPYSIDDYTVTIFVPDPRVVNHIKNNYTNHFITTISNFFDHSYDVRFISTPDLANPQPVVKEPVESLNSLIIKAGLNPKYTFETFVVGDNNNFAHAASLAVAESPGDTYNPLFLYGGVGLGKTHLMQAIGNYIIKQNPSLKVMYVTSEIFTNELIESIKTEKNTSNKNFREKYRNVDVLLIDDIQFIIGKESTQDEFFHTFNTLREAKKQVIISSDRPPKDFETLEDRLKSRFTNGLLVDISPPNYETRMAILHKKGEIEGYNIDMDVLEYIATNIKSNIRELEGSLTKLVAFSKFSKKPINVSLAEEVLRDFISPNAHREVTPELIIQTVAEHYQISVEDLISKKRDQKIAWPRQIAMYLCRSLTDIPLTKIGSYLGDRDHTTVSHGCDKVAETLAKDASFPNTLEIIKKKINPS